MKRAIDCVMLAAGQSLRMGQWKMTLPFQGSTLIETSVRNALKVCSRVLLVTGHRAAELEALFRSWEGVVPVHNPRYRKGMFSSVKAGTAEVSTDIFFLALGDMPLVEPSVYSKLLEYPVREAVIPKYRGKKGHPLLLSREVARCIAGFEEDQTLRDVLALYPTLTVPVDTEYILHDMDVPEDFRQRRPSTN